MQDVNHGLRLLMDGSGSALLFGRPELNLLAGCGAHSQILEPVVVYRIFFVLGQNSLVVAIFVENGALQAVWVINAKHTVTPTRLEDPVPLPEKHLLCLKLVEFFELRLDVLKFGPPFLGYSHFSWINKQFLLGFLKIFYFAVDELYVFFTFSLVKQRLFGHALLHGGYAVPLLKWGGPVVLIDVDFLGWVFAIHRDEGDAGAHDGRVHRVRAAAPPLHWLRQLLRIEHTRIVVVAAASFSPVLRNRVLVNGRLRLGAVLRT